MKSYLRFLSRNKLYTAIEVVGLSVALAFVILLSSYVIDDMSCDRFIKDKKQIYLCHVEGHGAMSSEVDLYSDIPQISDAVKIVYFDNRLWKDILHIWPKGQDVPASMLAVSENYLSFFNLPLAKGDPATALAQKNSVVISEELARTYFPDTDPIGQSLRLSSKDFMDQDFTISAIVKEYPKSILKQADVIIRYDHYKELEYSIYHGGASKMELNFIKIPNSIDLELVKSSIEEKFQTNRGMGSYKSSVTPFSEVRNTLSTDTYFFDNLRNIKLINTYTLMCLFVVIAALLNYIALTLAFSRFRLKEIATRRLLGTERRGVVLRCIFEAFVLLGVSFAFALMIALALKNPVSSILGVQLNPMQLLPEYLVMFSILCLMTVLASSLPALSASAHKPIDVIRGEERRKDKMVLGKLFIGFEGALSIFSIAVTLSIYLQTTHLINEPYGYDKDNLVYVSFNQHSSNRYLDEVKSLSFVEAAGRLSAMPARSNTMTMFLDENNKSYTLYFLEGDREGIETIGLKLKDEQLAKTDTGGYLYLCESSKEAFSFLIEGNDLVSRGRYVRRLPISGTCSEYRFGNAKIQVAGGMVGVEIIGEHLLDGEWGNTDLVIKVKGSEREGLQEIRRFYEGKGYAENVHFEATTFNGALEEIYTEERNMQSLLLLFTIVSILMTLLAIVALSGYYAQINTHDAALQKVFGCSRKEIFWRTVRSFLTPVIVSAFVAVPTAYAYIAHWLQAYPNKISNSPLIYIAALGIVIVIVLGSISLQAARLMRTNPAEALKKE